MATLTKPLGLVAALVLVATPAKAQLWYNGNWNGSSIMLPDERDLQVPDSRIYDNFVVNTPQWQVTGLFGDFLSNLTPTDAYWEIRSGVSAGNGGTLLYSGVSSVTWQALGPGIYGYNLYRGSVSGLNFLLPADLYWMTLAPMSPNSGRNYLAVTSGANGSSALLDGNSFWDSQTYSMNYKPVATVLGSNTDFAYGLEGTAIINPEPGTLILTGTGLALVSLGVLRRRRRAQS